MEDNGAGIKEDLFHQLVDFLKSLNFPNYFRWKIAVFAPGENDSGFELEDIPTIEREFDTRIDYGTTGWRVKFWSASFARTKPYYPLMPEELTDPDLPMEKLMAKTELVPECFVVLPIEYDRNLLLTEDFKARLKANINEHTGILHDKR